MNTANTTVPAPIVAPLPNSFVDAKRGPLPWIVLAVWLAWLMFLASMAIPEIGVSKKKLLKVQDDVPAESGARP